MTLISTSTSPSVFEDGKLRPGIYKIQNIYTETFLDIDIHSRDVCCRPAGSLGEGRGIVSRRSSSGVRVSDDHKWEIRRFGTGYTVQRVSSLPLTQPLPTYVNIDCSLTPENLNSSVPRWMELRTGPRCVLALTLWLGGLKSSSTTTTTVGLDTSGQTRYSPIHLSGSLTLRVSFHWGTKRIVWDLTGGGGGDGAKVRR